MRLEMTFSIPGKPFAKQRPKFSRARGVAYTPKETVQFENVVRAIAAEIFSQPLQGPIGVHVLAVFEPAKSWSRRKRADHLGQWHLQKPDADNVLKAVLDGLSRIAFADDSQVADQRCRKVWGEKAETVVTITALDPPKRKEITLLDPPLEDEAND